MSKLKNLVGGIFSAIARALGLHNATQRTLLVFILIAFAEAPFAVPAYWRMGYGIYWTWKNNLPPTQFMATATRPPSAAADNNTLPAAGPPAPRRAPRHP